MNVNNMFPSRFLKGKDLTGPVTVTIDKVVTEQLYRPGEGKVDAFVMYCQKASRGVVLNRILALQIAEAVGEPDTANWGGKQVVLYAQPMTVAGKAVSPIRARKIEGVKP